MRTINVTLTVRVNLPGDPPGEPGEFTHRNATLLANDAAARILEGAVDRVDVGGFLTRVISSGWSEA